MNGLRRARATFAGVIMVLFGLMVILFPKDSYKAIIFVLCVSLLFIGIKNLWFYLTMARHMVDGRAMLYRAIIVLDMGLFTLSMTNVSFIYVIIYLAGIHMFSGIIDILRSNESKQFQSGSWKLQFSHGLINVIMALLCIIFIKHIYIAVVIYGIGLIYSGVIRIIQAFRKTTIVYIQ